MKHYEILDHTADIRLKVTASTFKELYEGALLGMAQIIKRHDSVVCKQAVDVQQEIKLEASDEVALLIDFLSIVLTHTHIKKTLFDAVCFEQISKTSLHAIIMGRKTESFDEDIKAVTYHEAYVNQCDDGTFEAQVIFDI